MCEKNDQATPGNDASLTLNVWEKKAKLKMRVRVHGGRSTLPILASHGMGCGPAAASRESLLEMQTVASYPKPTRSESAF